LKISDTRFTTLIGATIPSSCNAAASHLRRASRYPPYSGRRACRLVLTAYAVKTGAAITAGRLAVW
jgi:hypothetical protein